MEMEKEYIITRGLEGNDPTQLKGVQIFLEPYVEYIIVFWWIVFFSTLGVLTYKLLKVFWEENVSGQS